MANPDLVTLLPSISLKAEKEIDNAPTVGTTVEVATWHRFKVNVPSVDGIVDTPITTFQGFETSHSVFLQSLLLPNLPLFI